MKLVIAEKNIMDNEGGSFFMVKNKSKSADIEVCSIIGRATAGGFGGLQVFCINIKTCGGFTVKMA